MRSAIFSEVPLTANSRGKILVVSTVDAIHDFQSTLHGGILEKAVVDLEKSGQKIGSIELSKKGSVRVSNEAFFEEIQIFDMYIAERLNHGGQHSRTSAVTV